MGGQEGVRFFCFSIQLQIGVLLPNCCYDLWERLTSTSTTIQSDFTQVPNEGAADEAGGLWLHGLFTHTRAHTRPANHLEGSD